MLKLTISLPVAAALTIGIISLASTRSASAQGRCPGGGGGMGYSRGGMGGSYFGGGYMGGGYSPSAWQPSSAAGNYPAAYGSASQNSTGQQSTGQQSSGTTGANMSFNNPTTVLAHSDDLNLTDKQVKLLEKMQKSGKQRAMLILTKEQRKQLVGSVSAPHKATSS
jgi:hypothetical protein